MSEAEAPRNRLNRRQATTLHLVLTLLLAAPVVGLMYFVWYPQPWFVVAGGGTLLLVFVGVSLAIGPLLTLVVVDPRKQRTTVRMDLAIIVVLQVAACAYGLHIIVDARPVFVVAAVDRYVLVTANQLVDADLALGGEPQFRTRSWRGPRLVGAHPGGDNGQPQRLFEVLGGGKDIDQLPRYYVPYANVATQVMQNAKPLDLILTSDPALQAQIRELQQSALRRGRHFAWLPLELRNGSYTVILDRGNGKAIAVLDVDPWRQMTTR